MNMIEKEDDAPRKKERIGKYVAPEERAANIVKQLDEFLRKGPRKGLKYSRWQQLAWYEIVDEIKRAETAQKNQDTLTKSAFLSLAVGFGTVGFWGLVLMAGNGLGGIAAALIVVAGLVIWRAMAKAKWFK
ncbi:hypothetical protein TH19_04570 [Thalassospira profundimaris]|uniref:Uncharacterized protein n=2 Tax=Thalassospira TaxID=168934 RepID=A0A367WCG7_9PROT|nr:hypothetical protein TH19_04570 [Thalassospira profundimaris]